MKVAGLAPLSTRIHPPELDDVLNDGNPRPVPDKSACLHDISFELS